MFFTQLGTSTLKIQSSHESTICICSASHWVTPRFPWPRTLTNHIGVSDIGGPKALLFYRPDMARVLSIG